MQAPSTDRPSLLTSTKRSQSSTMKKAGGLNLQPLSERCQYIPVAVSPPPGSAVDVETHAGNMLLGNWRTTRGLAALGAATLLFGVLSLAGNQTLYNVILDKKLALSPDAVGYRFWAGTTEEVPVLTSFYLWNVTNAKQVLLNGSKPIIQEIGPYTYREEQRKVNVTWNTNHTVTFMKHRRWHFLPSMSNASLDDLVTTLNVPLLGAAESTKDMNSFMAYMMNRFLANVDSQVFVTKSVRKLLFDGYDDPLLKTANMMSSFISEPVPFDKFAWFYARNDSSDYDGVWNMFTGDDTIRRLGQIHTWNYRRRTEAFEAECGAVHGSAGEMFPPRMQRRATLSFFSSDMCRTIDIPYERSFEAHGMPVRRFAADSRMLAAPESNRDNWCNCHGACLPDGLLDQSMCRFSMSGSTVSLPHMLFVDEEVRNQTVGQSPDPARHNLVMDVEPSMGIPVSVRARFQINIHLRPNANVDVLNGVKPVHLPVMWFQTTVDTNADMAAQLYTASQTIPAVLKGISWMIFTCAVLMLTLATCSHFRTKDNNVKDLAIEKPKHETTNTECIEIKNAL